MLCPGIVSYAVETKDFMAEIVCICDYKCIDS